MICNFLRQCWPGIYCDHGQCDNQIIEIIEDQIEWQTPKNSGMTTNRGPVLCCYAQQDTAIEATVLVLWIGQA